MTVWKVALKSFCHSVLCSLYVLFRWRVPDLQPPAAPCFVKAGSVCDILSPHLTQVTKQGFQCINQLVLENSDVGGQCLCVLRGYWIPRTTVDESSVQTHKTRSQEPVSENTREAEQMFSPGWVSAPYFKTCSYKLFLAASFCTEINNLDMISLSLYISTKGICGKCSQQTICPLGTKPLVSTVLLSYLKKKKSPEKRESKLESLYFLLPPSLPGFISSFSCMCIFFKEMGYFGFQVEVLAPMVGNSQQQEPVAAGHTV